MLRCLKKVSHIYDNTCLHIDIALYKTLVEKIKVMGKTKGLFRYDETGLRPITAKNRGVGEGYLEESDRLIRLDCF